MKVVVADELLTRYQGIFRNLFFHVQCKPLFYNKMSRLFILIGSKILRNMSRISGLIKGMELLKAITPWNFFWRRNIFLTLK